MPIRRESRGNGTSYPIKHLNRQIDGWMGCFHSERHSDWRIGRPVKINIVRGQFRLVLVVVRTFSNCQIACHVHYSIIWLWVHFGVEFTLL
jgi:hypothetical protein